jgi:hypothetical protein
VRRLVVLLLLAALVAGGGLAAATLSILGDDTPAVSQAAREVRDRVAGTAREGADRARERVERAAPAPTVRKARCPADAEGECRAVRGRIVYVERVDPDGDGDLHVVVADGSITAPGLTSIDVRPGLRPERDPRVGDVATGAGPVQRGHLGQRQIHALEFAVARRR